MSLWARIMGRVAAADPRPIVTEEVMALQVVDLTEQYAEAEAANEVISAVTHLLRHIDAVGQAYARLDKNSATPTRDVIDNLADLRNEATRLIRNAEATAERLGVPRG